MDILLWENTKSKEKHGVEQFNIKSQLKDYLQQGERSTLDNFVMTNSKSVTKKGSSIYGWLEWITCGLKPFSFVECELTRKYCKLDPISENSFKKYMSLVTKADETKPKTTLPDKFAIVYDGWTKHSTHYVGVFASFSNVKEPNFYETVGILFSFTKWNKLLGQISLRLF